MGNCAFDYVYGVLMMKIIFLDIDGVLNSDDYLEKVEDCDGYTEINSEKVKLLKEIVDRTGAEIVLSSTWRNLSNIPGSKEIHPQYTYLVESLEEFGLRIKDHTPCMKNNRMEEIKTWVDNHGGREKIKFVSLDDDFPVFWYALYGIGDCLVQTCFYEPDGGIQRKHVEMAVKILNGE